MDTTSDNRMAQGCPTLVHYTDSEHRTWEAVMERLTALHHSYACSAYLRGWNKLRLARDRIPQLSDLSRRLERRIGWTIAPVSGLVDVRAFLVSLGTRKMLSTQYIRDGADPEYTPEPDIVHEVVGHLPMLFDTELTALLRVFGSAAETATSGQMAMLGRLYWYTVEFGLIEEGSELKAWGAGLLSSIGELPYAFGERVEHLPFDAERAARMNYDHTVMQSRLFVIRSIEQTRVDVESFLTSSTFRRA